MATVGNLNVKLAATTQGFESSMNRAQGTLKSFAGVAKGAFTGMGQGAGMSSIGSMATSAIAGIHPLAAAAIAAGGALVYLAESTGKAAIAHEKMASRFGVSAVALKGLERAAAAAGTSDEELTHSMTHLQKELGQAAAGSEEARSKFAKLGLDWKAMSSGTLDEALGMLADKVKGLGSPAEKAAVAFAIFGRQGNAMLNMLDKGSVGINRMIERQKELGTTMDKASTDMIRANNAVTKMGAESLWAPLERHNNRVAKNWSEMKRNATLYFTYFFQGQAAMDKLVTDAGKAPMEKKEIIPSAAMLESLERAEEIRKKVKEINDEIGAMGRSAALAAVIPMINKGGATKKDIGLLFDAAQRKEEAAADRDLGKEYDTLILKLGLVGKTASQVKMAELTEKLGGSARKFAEDVKSIGKATAELEAKTALHSFTEGLRTQAQAFGKGANEAAAYELAQKGVTGAALDNAIALGKQADAMGRVRGLVEAKGPLGNFAQRIEDLQAALAAGKITADQFGMAGAKAFEGIEKSMPTASPNPQALTYGSSAAESAILNDSNRVRDNSGTAQERMQKVLEEQRNLAKQQLDQGREFGRALEKLNVPKVMKF